MSRSDELFDEPKECIIQPSQLTPLDRSICIMYVKESKDCTEFLPGNSRVRNGRSTPSGGTSPYQSGSKARFLLKPREHQLLDSLLVPCQVISSSKTSARHLSIMPVTEVISTRRVAR